MAALFCVCVCVCVCVFISTVKASSVCSDILDILGGTDQRSCVEGIILDTFASPFISVSESIKFHLKRRNSGPSRNRKYLI